MKRFAELYGPMGYQYYYYACQYFSSEGRGSKDFPPMLPYVFLRAQLELPVRHEAAASQCRAGQGAGG